MKSDSIFRKRKKRDVVPTPVRMICATCGAAVREITTGATLIAGDREAKYRHVEPPRGCSKGDPLFDGDVT